MVLVLAVNKREDMAVYCAAIQRLSEDLDSVSSRQQLQSDFLVMFCHVDSDGKKPALYRAGFLSCIHFAC